ncbi:MAG: DUF3570 domain-containing protein [Verrucomicrobiia bacterium]
MAVRCHIIRLHGARCAENKSVPLALSYPSIVLATWLLLFALPQRTRADGRADYSYEDYAENDGRIHVTTQGGYFESDVTSWFSLNANVISDAISGATPTGPPPVAPSTTVPTAEMHDHRYAGSMTGNFKFGNNTLSPQFSYSKEHDYRSLGLSLNDSIDFNEKNTTLSYGISHNFDQVLPNPGEDPSIVVPRNKGSTDGLLGISQVLDQNTIVGANLTIGYSDGYLSDPYKKVLFMDFPLGNPPTVFPELRPDYKFRQVVFVSGQHYFEPLKGAAELSYRFYHDSYGIVAHTASLQWNQKIGKHAILSPLFRYYTQTAANFYGTEFPGDPTNPTVYPTPQYYSSDYRLSALYSYTYGISLSVQVQKHVSLEVAYKHYEMCGTDGVTNPGQYPTANVFTGTLTIWF